MISIIIPTYNEEKYLPRLLKTIKRQTYKNYEIIVADNNSQDNTRQIAKQYGCIVTQGGLPAVGRNNGAKIAKGNLLVFLDADGIIPDNFLTDIMTQYKKKKFAVASGWQKADSEKAIDNCIIGVGNISLFLMQKISPHAPGSFIFAEKSIHEKINGFRQELILAEDHDYVERASKIGKYTFLTSPKIVVSVRRFESEGRMHLFGKYIYCTYYRLFKGPITTNIVEYEFGKL